MVSESSEALLFRAPRACATAPHFNKGGTWSFSFSIFFHERSYCSFYFTMKRTFEDELVQLDIHHRLKAIDTLEMTDPDQAMAGSAIVPCAISDVQLPTREQLSQMRISSTTRSLWAAFFKVREAEKVRTSREILFVLACETLLVAGFLPKPQKFDHQSARPHQV
jgi:hypothetical protein